jgi:hypothetical protein
MNSMYAHPFEKDKYELSFSNIDVQSAKFALLKTNFLDNFY